MATTSAITSNTPAKSTSSNAASQIASFSNLNANDFIKMMITELQNQDPSNPMDSSQILSELSQIGSITTSQQLQSTLSGIGTGQNLAAASALIGKGIQGLDTNGNTASGVVQGVVVNNGTPQLIVGSQGQAVTLSNVQQVINAPASTGSSTSTPSTSSDGSSSSTGATGSSTGSTTGSTGS